MEFKILPPKKKQNTLILFVWLVFVFFPVVDALASTEPGTVITNQAVLTYIDPARGDSIYIVSNISTISVKPFAEFTLNNNHNVSVAPGGQIRFVHELTNNGNITDSYHISVNTNELDYFSVVQDINGNGVADPAEPELSGVVNIVPGGAVDLVITAGVSDELLPGAILDVVVEISNSEGTVKSTENTVTIVKGLIPRLLKTSSVSCQTPLFTGDEVVHTIEIINDGSDVVAGIKLLLNGERVSGIVVEQDIPNGFVFTDHQYAGIEGHKVVRLAGVPGNSYISAEDWDGSSALHSAGILFPEGSFPAQTTERFSLKTVADDSRGNSSLVSTHASVDINGDGIPDFESNRTCHQFSGFGEAQDSSATLEFIEPSPSVRSRGGVVDFQVDSDFIAASQYTLDTQNSQGYLAVDDGVYLQLSLSGDLSESPNVKYDRSNQRFIETTLVSTLTGDQVVVLMLETATPGVFRSLAPVRLSDTERGDGAVCPAEPGPSTVLVPVFQNQVQSCVLGSGSGDQLKAFYLDEGLGFVIADASLVNPQGLVFNAQTLLPVSGAGVSIMKTVDNSPVIDRITGLPFRVVTGPDGLYTMPRLEPLNSYYIVVDAPAGHVFPSLQPASGLRAFNIVEASYGISGFSGSGLFTLGVGEEFTPPDIPLDSAIGETLIAVEKTVANAEVSVGDIATYIVTVKNLDERELSSVSLLDRPPYGYRYVPLSSTLNGTTLTDPEWTEDGDLLFELGLFEPGQISTVAYSLRVSAAALDSDGINRVSAIAVNADNASVVSPVSRVKTKVNRTGVLSDKAAIFGKIFVDQNCNGIQDDAEWPVGGVRLYLEDGTYTVSDGDGLYSLYGLSPGTRVLKIDKYTMPKGLVLKPVHTSQAADPYSRFVELQSGDFFRADFVASCPAEQDERLFAELKARNAMLNGDWVLRQAERFRAGEDKARSAQDTRTKSIDGDLSNGIIHGPLVDGEKSVIASVDPDVMRKVLSTQQTTLESLPDPKELVADITSEQAKAGTWIWPREQISTRGRFMVVVRDGIEPTLYVNNTAVSASHIGERLANRREKAQVVAWYGVDLAPGENKVEVKGTGPFGNERILASGVFKKPTSGSNMLLQPERDTVPADNGRTTLPVKIKIVDDKGYPALGVYFVTLESTDGAWLEEDIQRTEPGVQVRVSNGERVVHYISSTSTGEVKLLARTGSFQGEAVIQQLTESRPLIAVGLLEAGIGFSNTSYGQFAPSQPLRAFQSGTRLDSRAAVFVKGEISDRVNLTLAYDSNKSSETPLMRDVNPSVHYPIHGDASTRGFDAQSRSKLYLKLEDQKNSLMWGDFLADSGGGQDDLARSRRALTGFNSVIDSDYGRYRVFVSKQRDSYRTEEFPGNGSAMLYRLGTYPVVVNSEVVELVTRSRDNPGLIIARSRLNRFDDYSLDPVLGYVTFSSVIPTIDDQQNPVYVQISYDVESTGENYWVSGVRFDKTVNDRVQLGFSHTTDSHATQGGNRTGAYASIKAGENTKVKLGVAGSSTVNGSSGSAARMSLEHRWNGDASTSLTYARADKDFVNPGASITSGRVEARLNHKQALTEKSTVTVEALYSSSLVSEEKRTSFSARMERRLRNWLVQLGITQVTQQDFLQDDEFVTATFGVSRQLRIGDRSGQFNAEIEQDIASASRRRVSLGGKLQVHEHMRVYSNYELSNSLMAVAGLSAGQNTEVLTLGIESDLLPQTRMYSEYRMRGAFDVRDHELATGIRADYEVVPDVRVSPSAELIKSEGQGDSFAASVALTDARNPNSRKLFRLESRHTERSEYLGLRASYAARLNEDWTGVLTENLSRQLNDSGPDTLRHSFVAGFSRRPKLNNRHHMLMMYNWKEEEGVTPGLRRSVHLLSTHQNLQIDNRAVLSGRLGGKRQKNDLRGSVSTDFTLLADVRLNFDFNRRINLDLHGGVLATDNFDQLRYSVGAGVFYVINKNARVGVGYNFGGFTDEDLDAEEYHAHGLRFGFQFKFDEDSLKWLE